MRRAPAVGSEREVLVGMLREQRQIVRWKLESAADDALLAARAPSGTGAHGLVNHLTQVERWWWRDVVAGEDGLAYDWSDDDMDGEFRTTAPMGDLLAAYAEECARCDAVLDAVDLDATAARQPRGRPLSVRWVTAHMVQETARHLGHLDLLRELADGSVGDLPPEARR